MIKLDVNLDELLNDSENLRKTMSLVLDAHFWQKNNQATDGKLSLKQKDNFYNGKDINGKTLLINKWKYIVDTSSDFFLGSSFDITTIGGKSEKSNILFLKEQLKANNFDNELTAIAKSCSNYGNGFLMLYNDIGDTFPKFKKLNSLDTNVVYSCEVEETPLFAFTIRTINKVELGVKKSYYRIYVYFKKYMTIFITPTTTTMINETPTYNCSYDLAFINSIKNTENGFIEHDFNDIPLVEFRNNEEMVGDAECVYEAIMEYNKLKRDELANIDDQINSLLVFKNVRLGDEDDRTRTAELIKRDKMIGIEGEGVDVKFVNNPLDFSKTQLVAESLEEQIEHISRCSVLAGEKFSQNASDPILKLKTKPMLDLAKSKEKIFTLSVRRVLEMIKDFGLRFGEKDRRKYEFNMSKIQLAYAHSLPSNDQDIITMIANLSNAGILNPEIALQQISWIENVDSYIEGMEEYTKQKLAIDKERALVKNNNKGENPANNGANKHNLALQNSIPQSVDQKDNLNAFNMGLANKLSEDNK